MAATVPSMNIGPEPTLTAATAVAVAFVWTWLGMVLAISFLEAPLKFRAPGVTLPIGLGIGRLVFRALNVAETVLAAGVLACVLLERPDGVATTAPVVAAGVLAVQLIGVRPRLTRRSDAVLAGEPHTTRSHAHLLYVALELVKVVALVVAGIALLQRLLA